MFTCSLLFVCQINWQFIELIISFSRRSSYSWGQCVSCKLVLCAWMFVFIMPCKILLLWHTKSQHFPSSNRHHNKHIFLYSYPEMRNLSLRNAHKTNITLDLILRGLIHFLSPHQHDDGVGGLKLDRSMVFRAYEDAITWLWCVAKLSVFIMVADVATRWRLFPANNSVSLYPLKILRLLSAQHTLSLHIQMCAHTHSGTRWHTVTH